VQSGSPGSLTEAAPDEAGIGKTAITLVIVAVILLFDITTKLWVVENFRLHESVQVIGDFFRFTYTHNRGAAFGINVGENSRIFFLVLAILALGIVGFIFRATPATDRLRLCALSLVAGGAIGNILDRIRYEQGVVDFLDFGLGSSRFPVFNVADSAISVGAALLLLSFYLEGRDEPEAETGD